jgi:hypothetical protein
VLDLQPGVHLQEVEALVLADHELHRAGALVLDRLGQRHGLFAHRLARGLADEGRRRLLDDLLVAALDRALPLVQVDHIAVRIAQHLDLDVARALDELLDEHPVVAKAVAGLVAATLKPSKASLSLKATRRPLPPPPALALIITG